MYTACYHNVDLYWSLNRHWHPRILLSWLMYWKIIFTKSRLGYLNTLAKNFVPFWIRLNTVRNIQLFKNLIHPVLHSPIDKVGKWAKIKQDEYIPVYSISIHFLRLGCDVKVAVTSIELLLRNALFLSRVLARYPRHTNTWCLQFHQWCMDFILNVF